MNRYPSILILIHLPWAYQPPALSHKTNLGPVFFPWWHICGSGQGLVVCRPMVQRTKFVLQKKPEQYFLKLCLVFTHTKQRRDGFCTQCICSDSQWGIAGRTRSLGPGPLQPVKSPDTPCPALFYQNTLCFNNTCFFKELCMHGPSTAFWHGPCVL